MQSPLYEIVHDYAIMGEDSEDEFMYYNQGIVKRNLLNPSNKIFATSRQQTPVQQTGSSMKKRPTLSSPTSFMTMNKLLYFNRKPTQQKRVASGHELQSNRNELQSNRVPSVQAILDVFFRKESFNRLTPQASTSTSTDKRLIYDRSVGWLGDVKKRVHEQQVKLTQKVNQQCTFKPQLQVNSRSISKQSKNTPLAQPSNEVKQIQLYTQQNQQRKPLGKENSYKQIYIGKSSTKIKNKPSLSIQ